MEEPPRKTRYFAIKCNTFQSLGISFEHSIWAVPVHATKRLGDILNAALSTGRVVLIASVNGSKAWQGFAEMTSAVSAEPQPLTFAGDGDATGADNSATRMREGFPFKVKWLCRFQKMYINMISFAQTSTFKNELDAGRPLNLSRNLQELDAKTAETLCGMLEAAAKQEAEALQKEAAQEAAGHFFRNDNEEVSEATWNAFFAEVSRVGRVLYAGHVGSRCYNLHTETSDVDMLVIVAAPTGALLALHPPKDTHKNQAGFKPDFTLHEASGDTRMLETLYTEPRAVVAESEEWVQLRAVRDSFVTKDAVRKYVSEINSQKGLKKLAALVESGEKERAQKHMYILLRLAGLGLQLLRNERLHLWHEGASRQHFMDIRKGTVTVEQARGELTEALAEIERLLKTSELPESLPSTAMLDEWLLRIRRKELHEVPHAPRASAAPLLKAPTPDALSALLKSLPEAESRPLFVGGGVVVFAAPTSSALSVRTLSAGDKTVHYELTRFCTLLEKGNPASIQLLYIPDDDAELVSTFWAHLRDHRDTLVTQKVAQSLAALVKRQAADGAAGCSLLLRHTWRLALGNGSSAPAGAKDADLAAALDGAAIARLPQQCDVGVLDRWHAQVRIAHFAH